MLDEKTYAIFVFAEDIMPVDNIPAYIQPESGNDFTGLNRH